MGNLGGDRTTPAAKLRTAEREHQVVELRLRGLRWRPISEATGISIRGCYTAWQRALDHIRLPGAEEAKKQLLEAARLLESNLWTDYSKASEPTARAAIGNAILRCQERQSKLLGCDVPGAMVMQVAMNPPTENQEATVQQLKANLTVDEMRQLMMLSAKGAGRLSALAIETSESNVTPQMPPVSPGPSSPTIGETMDEQRARNLVQPAMPREPRSAVRVQTSPPMPRDDDYIEDDEAPRVVAAIEVPPPPKPQPAQPTLREQYEAQQRFSIYDEEIERLNTERSMFCPNGDRDPDWGRLTAKIQLLERRREEAMHPDIVRG
jgi:hypothetical protein